MTVHPAHQSDRMSSRGPRAARVRAATGTALLLSAALLTGCAADAHLQTGPDQPGTARVQVAASFYPVQWLAERIGGDVIEVRVLTPPGTEPHDVELTARDRAWLEQADAVLHLGGGFQPGVDRALRTLGSEVRQVDLLAAAGLGLLPVPDGLEEPAEDEVEAAAGGTDPHVWLDPVRATALAGYVTQALVQTAPQHTELLRANLAELERDLAALHAQLSEWLADCPRRTVVTSHAAFGYLTDRYGLEQVPLAGLSADDSADAGTLAALTRLARSRGVTSVFAEEVLSPAVAEAVAREVGARTRTLSVLEFDPQVSHGPGEDYLTVQRRNGAALRAGLGCR